MPADFENKISPLTTRERVLNEVMAVGTQEAETPVATYSKKENKDLDEREYRIKGALLDLINDHNIGRLEWSYQEPKGHFETKMVRSLPIITTEGDHQYLRIETNRFWDTPDIRRGSVELAAMDEAKRSVGLFLYFSRQDPEHPKTLKGRLGLLLGPEYVDQFGGSRLANEGEESKGGRVNLSRKEAVEAWEKELLNLPYALKIG